MPEIDWVQLAKDWGFVAGFAVVLLLMVHGMVKSGPPPDHLINPPSSGSVGRASAPAPRQGNIAEITAAISAAVTEYHLTTSKANGQAGKN
jgi:hypothetical protein